MLQPVAFYDTVIADLMQAAGRQFVACIPQYDSVDQFQRRWPVVDRFPGPDLVLGNFAGAMLGDSEAYIAALLGALRFLICGIQADAGVTLSAREVAKMLVSEPLCNHVGRVPFPPRHEPGAVRFGMPPPAGDFVHLVVQVTRNPFASARLLVALHGPLVNQPLQLAGLAFGGGLPYVDIAESFTPMPPGISIVRPTAQVLEVPNHHRTPSILDLDFELDVCTRRLEGAMDRIIGTVCADVTYTCITAEEEIARGPWKPQKFPGLSRRPRPPSRDQANLDNQDK
jgi:hypothetical protein